MTGDRSDPPTYLVAGGARVDAGKTTFSAGLVAHLADRAGDAVGVKPRAGNDLWFDHDDYLIATDAARLYGKDARTLAAANTRALAAADDGSPSPSAVTPESINPVHRLWRPTPGRTGMLGDAERTFLCDRVTTASGTRFVVNGAAEEAGLLPDALTDRLPLAEATRVRDVPAFNEVMAEAHLPAIERLADRVARTPVPVVVESYADVAGTLPRDGPVAPDAVAVVDPGRARLYAGDRYAKARAVAAGSPREGSREEHVDAVTEMIEPLATVSLPALSGDVRGDPDRIAAAYEPAYATLTDSVEN
ncbi:MULTISPECIES: ATPase [Halorubrum]|uniref:ATPase n=1 Tax=Halorubrum ezzemoulense TaxID=337243 RepID=A0A256JA37_HALEZ|nr:MULTISPECIES: ATPase [Halorubrum]MDB2236931.1 ATPase [Halorubrum ezzemoulense]MDB2241967.1 ATPase [Halorubrum ezzemoulense]MDB2247080.1 ATPase [Halorubrum ezzemoulense]MDB2250616.1 ATPase [Halorubrum ezzemoulense]MDB2260671.1 ATPase [Halorubrum ezzemoulense]